MKYLKAFAQFCVVCGLLVITGFSFWCVYLVWWIVEGMR